ncbi:transposase-like zinc-binding domain-containing protein [Catalinimonas alkaloidigena]
MPHCNTTKIIRNGHGAHTGKQKFICNICRAYFVEHGQDWYIE